MTPLPTAGPHRAGSRAAMRHTPGLVLVLAGLLALPLLGATPAHATGYRYWSFWDWSQGAWTYQQQGPATYRPLDGGVDGWRFAVSPDGGSDAARPRAAGDFAAICATTPPRDGRKRVAVVLDFGTPADAPSGERPPERRTLCAVVPTDASSAEVLAAAVPPLRYNTGGVLCAITGYPRQGCGEVVAPTGGTGGTSADGGGGDDDGGGGGPVLGLALGGGLIALVAVGAAVQARRRRTR
ncbi:SCO2322 family protein [Peterkaempfera bronchialis]|nr:SCO2322 family protein [Peterkaempfera bronchialis]